LRHPARPARRRQHDASWNHWFVHFSTLVRSVIRLNRTPSRNCFGVAPFTS
jgi:hypothetical protein